MRSRGHIFSPIIMKLVFLIKSGTSLKMFHVRSKCRSLGQMLEKPFVRSRGHIFSPIIMKLCHNVCLDENWDNFKNGSCRIKN